jgi:hypothetical protein
MQALMRFLTSLLDRTPLALVILGIVVFVVGVNGGVSISGVRVPVASPWNYGVAALGIVCFVVGLSLIVSDHLRSVRTLQPRSSEHSDEKLIISGRSPSNTPEFYQEVERLIKDAHRVKFISMGLQVLLEGHILETLTQRAISEKVEVVACLANPFSPEVIDRLIEEESAGNRPPVGRLGIERNIRALLKHLDNVNNPSNFRVLLFEHYPTYATYMIDRDVFIVPYMYRMLGWQAPVLHFKDKGSAVARSLVDSAERMLKDAVPAQDVFGSERIRRKQSDDWTQVCVAIIPDAKQRVSRFGAAAVGFDISRGSRAETSLGTILGLEKSVGDLAERGFCAPVVGPLYLPNQPAVQRVVATLTLVAADLPRFHLTNWRIEDRWRTTGEIVLSCQDDSGVAEALHSELAPRVYRRALTVLPPGGRPATGGRFAARDSLMIRRYGSPDVLSRFDVHFPICVDPPMDSVARRGLVEHLANAFREVGMDSVLIDRVHVIVKESAAPNWEVRATCDLK